MSDNFNEKSNKPSHYAYTVSEGKGDQNYWTKIGAAWPTKDDGLTLTLDAIPRDGMVQLRSREQLEQMRAERAKNERERSHERNPRQRQ